VFHVLRVAVGIVGGALLLIGLALLASGGVLTWPGIQLVIVGGLGLLIAFFERLRYGVGSAGGAMRPTDERFIDPTTGQRTRVWIDPATGERSYQHDPEP
jgi:hypothetical protein